MRNVPASILVLLLAVAVSSAGVSWASGFGGSDAPPARIPVPARDFRATVEDQSGVRIVVSQISFDGEVFLFGRIGEGQATVPFEKIKDARFEPAPTAEHRIAFVTLTDGSTTRLQVAHDVPTYGKTSFGTYSIPVDKLRKIEFQH